MEICFASHNPNKVKEINAMLPGNLVCKGLSELGFHEEIEENGASLEENALIKAKAIYERMKVPVFADDSGLFVEALQGDPGIYSARYAGPEKDDEANIQKLLNELAKHENKQASFKTVIAWIDESGGASFFHGEIKGSIIAEQRGSNGFGYDPVFIPQGYEQTFAELPAPEKNSISHRSKALARFMKYLSKTSGR